MARMNWDRVRSEDRLRQSADYSEAMDRAQFPVPPKPRRTAVSAKTVYVYVPLGRKKKSPNLAGKRLNEWADDWQAARGATSAERDAFLHGLAGLTELQTFAAKDLRPFLAHAASARELLKLAAPHRSAPIGEASSQAEVQLGGTGTTSGFVAGGAPALSEGRADRAANEQRPDRVHGQVASPFAIEASRG